LPFTRQVGHCQRPLSGREECPSAKLVGVEAVVQEAVSTILHELSYRTVRVPPLMCTRLHRGGKTTTLYLIFDQLKIHNICPIFITFSNNGPNSFQLRPNESQREAILRLIAVQLIDLSNIDPTHVICNEKELDRYLQDQPVVLIIDELGALSSPIDHDARRMLREVFLDKPNRYLLFSSCVPLDVDPPVSRFLPPLSNVMNARDCIVLGFSPCLDLAQLRDMSPSCAALNPCGVAYYGGIPSLIFSVQTMHFAPRQRFEKLFPRGGSLNQKFSLFLSSVYDGNLRPELRQIEEFGILSAPGRITWPLCYIGCIFSAILLERETDFITRNIDELLTHSSLLADTSKHWECIVNIALALYCYRCVLCCGLAEYIPRSSDRSLDATIEVECCYLPEEYHTLDSAVQYIINRPGISNNALVVLAPMYARFPDFDLLIIRRTSTTNMKINGYQMKLSRSDPKRDLPAGVNRGYLMRGDPPEQSSLRRGWSYLGSDAISELLGYSLRLMAPTTWPSFPSAADDCFD
jgi:hypothetical protein